MYDLAGIIMQSSTYCIDTACTGLTEEEIRFVCYGADERDYYGKTRGTMARWPRKTDWSYVDDYEVDDDNDILYDKDVVITDANVPQDHDGPITVFLDDGSWESGCYCDHCSKELIKPYTIDCFVCNGIAAEGDFALDLEIKQNYDAFHMPCRTCIEKHFRTLLDTIAEQLEEEAVQQHTIEMVFVETLFGVHTLEDKNTRKRSALYSTYADQARRETHLFAFLKRLEAKLTLAAKTIFTDFKGESEAIEQVVSMVQETVLAWEEEFCYSAQTWDTLLEKYEEHDGF